MCKFNNLLAYFLKNLAQSTLSAESAILKQEFASQVIGPSLLN